MLGWGFAAGGRAAAQVTLDDSSHPIMVSASEGIEWLREDRAYVARGAARATRGENTVSADTLTALYRETANGETEIFQLEALGNVVIISPGWTANGDKAVYNLDTAVAHVSGGKPRLVTAKETIEASGSLEYRDRDLIAMARNNAVASDASRRVRADLLTAYFERSSNGTLEAVRIEALGNVVITTLHDVARGDKGVYNMQTGIATLSGNVKITREDTQLNGEIAEIDVNAGIGRLLAGAGKTGRVEGLFMPRSRLDGTQEQGSHD